jgi:hypothetical protein
MEFENKTLRELVEEYDEEQEYEQNKQLRRIVRLLGIGRIACQPKRRILAESGIRSGKRPEPVVIVDDAHEEVPAGTGEAPASSPKQAEKSAELDDQDLEDLGIGTPAEEDVAELDEDLPVAQPKAAAVPKRLKEYVEPKWIDHNYKNPTLYDLVSYVRLPVDDLPRIVGEDETGIISAWCLSNGTCFGIEGKSGSAKTVLMDKILYLIPEEYVATMYLGSAKAMNYNVAGINGRKVLYIPEINHLIPANAGKKDSDVEKTLKLIAEGKPAELNVVRGTKIVKFVIDPIPACYTRAVENAFDVRPELRRRFVVVETNSSQETIEQIHQARNRDRHTLFTDNSGEKKLVEMLQEHMTNLVNLEGVQTFDPFSEYLINIIPQTEKSKCYLDQYYAMLDACAKFHFAERKRKRIRMRIDGRYMEKLALFINLEDHFLVYKVFHKQFVNSLSKYEDDEFIDAINQIPAEPDWHAYLQCGLDQMDKNQEIKKLCAADKNFVEDWYLSQLDGTSISTTDYKTGNKTEITKI